jgi:hypothetical protein
VSRSLAIIGDLSISEVRGQIQVWRQTRRCRGRMPEALWEAAVDLARTHGVNPVARALGLDFYGLKGRLGRPASAVPPRQQAFVEVAVEGAVPIGGSPPTIVVEMGRADGGRMRVELSSGELLLRLSEAFWARRG